MTPGRNMQLRIDDEWAAGVCMGLTVYLAERPGKEVARRVLDAYLRVCPRDRLRAVWLDGEAIWTTLPDDQPERAIRDRLSPFGAPGWDCIRVWDESEDERSWSVSVQRVHRVGMVRAPSVCQVLAPLGTSPDLLRNLAREWTDVLPGVLSGHGGFVGVFHPSNRPAAFDALYGWAMRFRALDIDDLNATLPSMWTGLKGVSWLTIVGNTLWRRLPAGDVATFLAGTVPPIAVEALTHGRIVAIGDEPVLLDRHSPQSSHSYAAVHAALRPIMSRRPFEFSGRFAEEARTAQWQSRLAEGSGW